MKRKSICALVLIIELFLTTGCTSDVKNIEKLNYVSAIGVDYIDGKYHSYLQLLEFLSVAKKENGQKAPTKIWVGEGVGVSFEDSLFDLYQTSQEKIYWGHMTAILVSESAFKQGFGSIYDSFVRYYEFRLTPWVFGTRESVKEIFDTAGFFGQSSLNTILHEPEGVYSQDSSIKSVKLHRLIGQINEPGFTSCIPTLVVNKNHWSEDNKSEPKLMVDGAIFLKNDMFQSYLPLKKLTGLRWIQSGSMRAALSIPNKEKASIQIVVDKPKTKLKLANREAIPQYDIEMKATGYIVNRSTNDLLGLKQLTDKTTIAIEKEIRELYQTGLKKRTDILNLEYYLYRDHYEKWESISAAEEMLLTKDTIHTIKIDLNIIHSSSEKNKRIERSK